MQPPQTATSLRALHLLRALLREASYLPDADARRFFHRYIVKRFRAYHTADNASPSLDKKRHGFGKQKDASIVEERTRLLRRQGSKGLNYLRRANNGEHGCLKKILFFTYGRIGTRKYALLADLLRPDDPTAVLQPSPLQKLYYSNDRFLSFFDAPKKVSATDYNIPISDHYRRLKTTLKAQVQNEVALGREIKRHQINTPINNVWGRPMPIRRARNIVRKWYAETMTRLLPPLPISEFDNMQAMADGRREVSLVKRRAPAVELHPHPVEESPAADRFAKLVQDALVLEKPSRADTRRPRHIDAPIMRRLYASVLVYCSKLEWNEKYKKWESVWGRMRGMSPTFNSAAHHDDLFAGVDEKGNLPKEKQPKSPQTPPDEDDMEAEKYVNVPFYVNLLPPEHPTRVTASKFLEKRGRVQSASGANAPRKPALATNRSERRARNPSTP
ncbi:uncharacterized protein CC84DRAFT_1101705 [Paraphaeosphaeria sporulosa]|uniref:LYR motif-containing protein Cup1-like N-terminal domain-containing protein n=1 Tax=Paraphaeosphaeria sporulosa TaxID=1460663 RepID=A0A177C123_9PLEO|nr:uncharacterized protein CC84DRAFT_1101705 [Paraphaeosphaeria sporulosa]OAG00911.1 hypothetical protein CC84DRAFT_1101705 [Paraphaeosphaeria sporulosa]